MRGRAGSCHPYLKEEKDMEVCRKTAPGLLAMTPLLALLLAVTALASAAAPLRQASASPSRSSKPVSYNGISFSYDSSLAREVAAGVVPEQKGDSNTPYWTTHPDEVIFEFKDFAYSTGEMMPARIYVFPVSSDYRYLNPSETIDFWGREVASLRSLLAQRPKLTGLTTAQGESLIPFLPPINAGGFLVGKQDYLSFRNGAGLRYLVQFAQEVRTASHADTIYTYQGMTNDGKYYVAAHFPAFLATPPNLSIPQPGTQKDLDNYYVQLRRIVDQTNNAGFLPNLDSLDSIMTSLMINSSAVTLPSGSSSALPGMPRTGIAAYQDFLSGASLMAIAGTLALVFTLLGLAIRGNWTVTR
jgi:hypothetical protein